MLSLAAWQVVEELSDEEELARSRASCPSTWRGWKHALGLLVVATPDGFGCCRSARCFPQTCGSPLSPTQLTATAPPIQLSQSDSLAPLTIRWFVHLKTSAHKFSHLTTEPHWLHHAHWKIQPRCPWFSPRNLRLCFPQTPQTLPRSEDLGSGKVLLPPTPCRRAG